MAASQSGLLATFQKHIEDMRSLVHCKICLKPFYEPYTLSCGHTYCYSCLSSWLGGNHQRDSNKNCPDCRTTITREPCPNYTLRDLVHMFCNRAELLPEDETVQEHEKSKAEEAQTVVTDRSGRGLFKGIFSRRLPAGPLGRPQFITDHEDGGILRCPFCAHEVVAGICTNGGCGFGEFSEDDYDSDDDIHLYNPFNGIHRSSQSISDDETDSEDEDDGEMDDFIERDDVDLPNEDDMDDMAHRPSDDVHHPAYIPTSPNSHISIPISEDQYQWGQEGVVHNHLPGYDIYPDSDGYESGVPYSSPRARDYPIDYNSDSANDDRSEREGTQTSYADQSTDYGSDASSVREVSPPRHARGTKRRIIDSSDEEDEGEDEEPGLQAPQFSDIDDGSSSSSDEETDSLASPTNMYDTAGGDASTADASDDSESSDDTVTRPPQSSNVRRNRLEQHRQGRARRGGGNFNMRNLGGSARGYGARRSGSDDDRPHMYPVVDLTSPSPRRFSATRVY